VCVIERMQLWRISVYTWGLITLLSRHKVQESQTTCETSCWRVEMERTHVMSRDVSNERVMRAIETAVAASASR
jgi:hypothetical protein